MNADLSRWDPLAGRPSERKKPPYWPGVFNPDHMRLLVATT